MNDILLNLWIKQEIEILMRWLGGKSMLAAKPEDPSVTLRTSWWKERLCFSKLSPDLHTLGWHLPGHMNTINIHFKK